MAKRIFKERYKFPALDVDLNKMTVKELRDFVKNGVDKINKIVEDRGDNLRKPQVKKLESFYQTMPSKNGKLKYGVSYMRKADLIQRAKDVRTFIKLDKDYDVSKFNRAYETFKNAHFEGITKEQYSLFINVVGAFDAAFIEKALGSQTIMDRMKEDVNGNISYKKFVDAINAVKEIYDKNNGAGTQDEYKDIFYKALGIK